MKFKYIGDADVVSPFGLEFIKGKSVDVSDPVVIGKLSGNPHFAEVKSRKVQNDQDAE